MLYRFVSGYNARVDHHHRLCAWLRAMSKLPTVSRFERRLPDGFGKNQGRLWSGVGGAALTTSIGFNFAGLMTTGGAMAKESAEIAVADAWDRYA
jgi:hypothetical protein